MFPGHRRISSRLKLKWVQHYNDTMFITEWDYFQMKFVAYHYTLKENKAKRAANRGNEKYGQ